MMPEQIPDEIGHYQVNSLLGTGSSSTVYKAFDPRLSRHVAIKLLHSFHDQDVLDEARVLAAIQDPHVVTIFDIVNLSSNGQTQTALVMEYLPGETLADRLVTNRPNVEQALQFALEIARGLSAIHHMGLVHRDLKAENIYFDSEQLLKVGDLGIARPINHTPDGLMAGSIYSLSPEQINHNPVGIQSDLFALGVLLYQMLSKRHPFSAKPLTGDTSDNIIDQTILDNIVTAPPAPLNSGHAKVDALVMQLLEKNPSRRPQSAEIVIEQIKNVLNCEFSTYANATITQDNPALEAARAKLQLKTQTHNKRIRMMALVSTVLISSMLSWQFWPKQPHYIAVLNPTVLSGQDIPDLPLIQASIHQATIQVIQSLQHSKMVAADEVSRLSQLPENIRQIQQVTAADEVLYTQLNCLPAKCAVTFSRWHGIPAVLIDQEQVQIPTDRLVFISDFVQDFLSQWLAVDLSNSNSLKGMSEQRFRRYLQLKNQYHSHELSIEPYIKELESLKDSDCFNEEICYSLLLSYRKIYIASRDDNWLANARQVINQTPNIERKKRLVSAIAEIELLAREFKVADKWLSILESKNAIDDHVKSLRARWYFVQGLTVKGKVQLQNLIEDRPSVKHLFNYALMMFRVGEIDEAIVTLDTLFERSPNFMKGLELNGILQFLKGEWTRVIENYQKLIALNKGENPITQSNLGFAYLMKKEFDLAHKHLETAYQLSPTNPQILINLADTEFILKNRVRAYKHYNKVIELVEGLTNKSKNDLLTLAQALAQTNQRKKAIDILIEIESNQISEPHTFYYLSLIYVLLQEPTTAKSYQKKAIRAGIPAQWFDLLWFEAIE